MNKNKQLLDSFVEYCNDNPEQRFYQALTNWSGARCIAMWRGQDLVAEKAFDNTLFYDVWNLEKKR